MSRKAGFVLASAGLEGGFWDFASKRCLFTTTLTADHLPIRLAAQVWCDPQFGGVPEAVHFPGEVSGELGRVNGDQGLVVRVGSLWRWGSGGSLLFLLS